MIDRAPFSMGEEANSGGRMMDSITPAPVTTGLGLRFARRHMALFDTTQHITTPIPDPLHRPPAPTPSAEPLVAACPPTCKVTLVRCRGNTSNGRWYQFIFPTGRRCLLTSPLNLMYQRGQADFAQAGNWSDDPLGLKFKQDKLFCTIVIQNHSA